MKTMLIAIGSEILTEELARTYQNQFHIYTCSRGDDTLKLLQEVKPDILIINLSLSHITGLEVLQRTQYTPSAILAITNYLSESIIQDACSAGVCALIRLPCSIKCITSTLEKIISL